MVAKSDRNTPLTNQIFFSDFLDNFDSHPVNNTLARAINADAVKQSMRNLVLTNLGERLFQPTIGSDVLKSLFEPNDIVTAENISYYIKNTLKQNEPRVLVLTVDVTPDTESSSFNVTIIFSLVNNTTTQSLDIILKRVR